MDDEIEFLENLRKVFHDCPFSAAELEYEIMFDPDLRKSVMRRIGKMQFSSCLLKNRLSALTDVPLGGLTLQKVKGSRPPKWKVRKVV